MSKIHVCEKHAKTPALGYSPCPGCEVERLNTEISLLKTAGFELVDALRMSITCGIENKHWWINKAISAIAHAEKAGLLPLETGEK